MAQQTLGSDLLPAAMDQLESLLLSWSISPSSGYSTEPCTPSTPTSTTDSLTPWTENDDCCSLTNPTWRNSSWNLTQPDGEANATEEDQVLSNGPPAAAHSNGSILPSTPSPRIYTSVERKTIVMLDVEQMGPDEKRHHPLDKVGPSPAASKIFVRKPWGLAINKRTEQIYIADRQYHVILIFGPDGEYQGKFGGPGSEPGLFNRPTGLAFDAAHNRIFVADKDNHRVQVFCATTNQFLFTFGSQGQLQGQFSFPWGIAVSLDGSRIAVTDARNNRVQLLTSDGQYIRQFMLWAKMTTRRNTILNYPRGIVFDSTGNYLYVTDFNLHRLCRLDVLAGGVETIVDRKHLFRPSGIDVDASGNILVCDTRNHRIKIFRPNGKPVAYIKRIGGMELDLPLDIAVMPAGHIAVMDLNGRVRIF